ncbi:MAG: hypothetical protein ACLSHC_07295 [Bilophila wadsworthia]
MVPALQLLQTKSSTAAGSARIPLRQPHVQQAACGRSPPCPRTREAALIRAFAKNEADGVLYHYPGRLVGDYDLPENGSAIRAMLLRGLEAAQDARS